MTRQTMGDDLLGKSSLAKFAGFGVGILLGGSIGPTVFALAGLRPATAATAGSFVGAIIGYVVVSVVLFTQRRRRDRELAAAAEAVKTEAGLPKPITIKVKDAHIILGGEVEDYTERHKAELIMSTLPGVKAIVNKIRLRPATVYVTASPDEIRRRIQESFVRRAEEDGRGIRVLLDDSRLVLEGTVHSWREVSEAEDVAWRTPGIAEVENRLHVA